MVSLLLDDVAGKGCGGSMRFTVLSALLGAR